MTTKPDPAATDAADCVCAVCGHEQAIMDPCKRCRSVRVVPISIARDMFGENWRDNFGSDPRSKATVQRIVLMFEHTTCDEVTLDIQLPLPDAITESADAMAARVCPACPICKLPMHYVGFSFPEAA